jgi:hypothetical protein
MLFILETPLAIDSPLIFSNYNNTIILPQNNTDTNPKTKGLSLQPDPENFYCKLRDLLKDQALDMTIISVCLLPAYRIQEVGNINVEIMSQRWAIGINARFVPHLKRYKKQR